MRRRLPVAVVTEVLKVFTMASSGARPGLSTLSRCPLEGGGETLICITTARNVNQSKAAPVCSPSRARSRRAHSDPPTTWKAKWIRRGSPVIVWIGRREGSR
jgi:hypothetical protein